MVFSYKKPLGLIERKQEGSTITIYRLSAPDLLMELNLMEGPLLELLQRASPTGIKRFTSGALSVNEKDLLLKLFFGALEADAIIEGNKIVILEEKNGIIKKKYNFQTQSFSSCEGSAIQSTTIILDDKTNNAAFVGYRTNEKFYEKVKKINRKIIDTIMF